MTKEEIIANPKYHTCSRCKYEHIPYDDNPCILCYHGEPPIRNDLWEYADPEEQEPCEMTAEEYRQRMIQAFHNADCDELIAVCVLPTEKEFEHLEWLLKNHYKQEPKIGHWIKQTLSVKPFGEDTVLCDQCAFMTDKDNIYNYCPNCGIKMESKS